MPPSANLIQGQNVAYSIQLSSANGFDQLAHFSVIGVPSGVTASFNPAEHYRRPDVDFDADAPPGQATGTSRSFHFSGGDRGGLPVTQTAAPRFRWLRPRQRCWAVRWFPTLGDTAGGVTIKTLGLDGNGNTTGCTGDSTISDAAGNFALTNLPMQCTGPQLISFDGTTATAPPASMRA